ncbi:hypothetical protein FLAVO9AF_40100 [Flavobacterium sp. 9AF]|uniref:hypothetical protein n=1 Tax=Flavobacterium sp. 9AF TaxID=2653142 RepID=UPI0012EEFC3D|nr:hypothetical protein [Flavobacterium sp. 9AF]VXB99693.1 hypothetical protein FLAVO9AF_40100 [Flavobacterium sp. 9AF]
MKKSCKYIEYKKNNFNKTILLTIDDLNHAEYTSSHAEMFYELDEIEGYDISEIDNKTFENKKQIGHLSIPTEFFIGIENFKKKIINSNFTDVCDKDLQIEQYEIDILEKINGNPFLYYDKKCIIKNYSSERFLHGFCWFSKWLFFLSFRPI